MQKHQMYGAVNLYEELAEDFQALPELHRDFVPPNAQEMSSATPTTAAKQGGRDDMKTIDLV